MIHRPNYNHCSSELKALADGRPRLVARCGCLWSASLTESCEYRDHRLGMCEVHNSDRRVLEDGEGFVKPGLADVVRVRWAR